MRRLLIVTMLAAGAAPALAQPRGLSFIPAQFQGRWAGRVADCRAPANLNNSTMTITSRGWSQWEDGGTVIRRGQVRGTTHYFRVRNFSGATELDATMALRRIGNRLTISWVSEDGDATTETLTRCR